MDGNSIDGEQIQQLLSLLGVGGDGSGIGGRMGTVEGVSDTI